MKAIGFWTAAGALAVSMMLGTPEASDAAVLQDPYVAAQMRDRGGKAVVVRRRPPAKRTDVRGARPSPRYAWVDGYWRYHRGRFVWVRGSWVFRPHRRAVYVPPRWVSRHGGWVLIGGHWRFRAGRPAGG